MIISKIGLRSIKGACTCWLISSLTSKNKTDIKRNNNTLKDKLHILVIEDDELDRMIIKRALDGADMNTEVLFADTIESGKKAVIGRNYDCIFIDYNLPGGNGLELMKYIREAGNNSPI